MKNSPIYKSVGTTPILGMLIESKKRVVGQFDNGLLAGHLKIGGKIG